MNDLLIADWLHTTELDDDKILDLLAASMVAVLHRAPQPEQENMLSRVIWSLEVMHKAQAQ